MHIKNTFIQILFFAVLLCAEVGNAQPILERDRSFHPFQVEQSQGMVVAQEKIAAQVGAHIMDSGGNAIDAAVATGFALAVTFPQAGNLGGGGFMLVYLAESKEVIALDYREAAPGKAFTDMFLDGAGRPDNRLSRTTALSSGVPGTVAGLVEAQARYGVLSLREVMQPAIDLASEGFMVSDSLAWSLGQSRAKFLNYPSSTKYFLNENKEPRESGELWRQPDLANTLSLIADQGRDGFYSGRTAQLIVDESARHGGLISLQDLDVYQTKLRRPVKGNFGDYEIYSMPPPSSGGVHLVQILGVLERLGIERFEHNSAAYLHRLVEASKYAYADRSKYLGDPDYVEVPVAALTSDTYLERIAHQIKADRATPSLEIEPGKDIPWESNETTHFSVWDGDGNVVSNTYTLNFSYGNGIAVEGAGFLLNNEMDDFSIASGTPNGYGLLGGSANSVEPGKRPLSSMSPTIVLRNGKPVIVTGSPGGSAIITVVAQVLLNMMVFDMNASEAVSVPRIHHQWLPDSIRWESGISADTRALMRDMGHIFNANPSVWGKAETISSDGKYLFGGVDPRWPDSGAASE